MTTIRTYTTIEQSRKLAEILPLESADMFYYKDAVTKEDNPRVMDYSQVPKTKSMYYFPCWSLAALSEFILPYIADDDGNNYKFYLSKDGLDRWVAYYKGGMDNVSIHICEESDNMIDVILEMVCWLKKEEYI